MKEAEKPYKCPCPGCEIKFETKYELDEHFKHNKICNDMSKRILKAAKKGLKL